MSEVGRGVDVEALEAGIAEEARIVALVKALATDLAREARPIWHWGDGWGGYVRQVLEETFDREGLAREFHPTSSEARRSIPAGKRAIVFARDGLHCLECGATEELTIDHIMPVSRGGSDDMDNLRTVCRSCNSKKGAK